MYMSVQVQTNKQAPLVMWTYANKQTNSHGARVLYTWYSPTEDLSEARGKHRPV